MEEITTFTLRPLFLREIPWYQFNIRGWWAPETFWRFWRRDKLQVPIGVRTPDGPARSSRCTDCTNLALRVMAVKHSCMPALGTSRDGRNCLIAYHAV